MIYPIIYNILPIDDIIIVFYYIGLDCIPLYRIVLYRKVSNVAS